jgi:hypothetical protein
MTKLLLHDDGGNIMRALSSAKPLLIALTLAVSGATGFAQNAATPPAAPAAPAPPSAAPPAPAAALAAPAALPADLQACLQETGDFTTRGKAAFYVIGIANTCARRLRCEIFANVTGVRGSTLGHNVMRLGPAGSAAAKQAYTMRVKGAGGTVQVSRDCKAL